ncbi:MAG: GAF domain-containing protein [Crocinitomicaceae bacterium]|nr:GAF domain-containing protein [Crocinitomicaceae bacterium]
MAEELVKIEGSKGEIYSSLIPQIKALVGDEKDLVANQANIAAALKHAFGFLWVGFYNVREDMMILGPFQGPIACTRIRKGKGVCGTVWETKKHIVVDNVDEFPGHIACSTLSKSEIVIPLIQECQVIAVLDIDSDQLTAFDENDVLYLNEICEWFVTTL